MWRVCGVSELLHLQATQLFEECSVGKPVATLLVWSSLDLNLRPSVPKRTHRPTYRFGFDVGFYFPDLHNSHCDEAVRRRRGPIGLLRLIPHWIHALVDSALQLSVKTLHSLPRRVWALRSVDITRVPVGTFSPLFCEIVGSSLNSTWFCASNVIKWWRHTSISIAWCMKLMKVLLETITG